MSLSGGGIGRLIAGTIQEAVDRAGAAALLQPQFERLTRAVKANSQIVC
jgi:hypothetical protein